MNVNTGNEYMHNPIPLKPKFEDREIPKSAFLRRDNSANEGTPCFDNTRIFKSDSQHNFVFKNMEEPPKPELTKLESSRLEPPKPELLKTEHKSESQDFGDAWVETKQKAFENENYNWNREVEGLLESEEGLENLNMKQEHLHPSHVAEKPKKKTSKSSSAPNVNIRRHRKKSKKQLDTLNAHFDMDKEWSLELVEKLAEELCLEKDQVYKWNWDKRKRLRKKALKQGKLSDKKSNKRAKHE
jgi:hypothetical protein